MVSVTGVTARSGFSANAVQVVNPGESIVFTDVVVPCTNGLIRHRNETGNFLLSGFVPQTGCPCQNKSATYLVDFGANISIIDGATVPSTTMIVTPAAVDEYFNVSRATNVQIWNGCCETLAIRNLSDQPIQVQNANIIFARPDMD